MPWAKILDFGRVRNIAETQKSGERLTMRGETLGDQDFISPEQARSARDADIRADIYALGASFFWMLTGRPPHDYKNPMQKLTALFKTPPPPVSTLRKDTPPGVEKVIAKMLAIDVADRYQTPAEVVWDITPFALGSDEVLGEEPAVQDGSHVAREDSEQMASLARAPEPEKNDSVYEFLAKLATQAKGG
jgi:serine/threonine protein kinase